VSEENDFVELLDDHYSVLKVLVDSLEKDINKSLKGNKSAGVRLRKTLREIGKTSSAMNKSSLLHRKSLIVED
tara:strand:+ start:368 stop:586 length:219 start_codon:yes stop_codon:yes gene_type:complete